MVLFDHPLDFPGGDRGAIFLKIEDLQLFLPIAEVGSPEAEDAAFLETRDFPGPRAVWSPAFAFQGCEAERIIARMPLVEALAGDAEVAAGQGHRLFGFREIFSYETVRQFSW